MIIERTPSGNKVARFTDLYGQQCTIQESYHDGDDALWLGVERDPMNRLRARMHLSRDQARAMLPYIKKFIETGSIE